MLHLHESIGQDHDPIATTQLLQQLDGPGDRLLLRRREREELPIDLIEELLVEWPHKVLQRLLEAPHGQLRLRDLTDTVEMPEVIIDRLVDIPQGLKGVYPSAPSSSLIHLTQGRLVVTGSRPERIVEVDQHRLYYHRGK